jgi:16S rRNA (guanine(966)-N(2))-methyltransferase RsmD
MSLRLSGGRKLTSPAGQVARPTPARLRLAVMNMLAGRLAGGAWLDLFCGSGVMACEALQRGASRVVAVDQDRRMVATARGNLAAVAQGQAAKSEPLVAPLVLQREVLAWLRSEAVPPQERGFDLIYADPPYAAGLYGDVAEAVARGGWLASDGLMLWECSSLAIPALPAGWELKDQRRYGSSTLLQLRQLSP